jgi:hypothetical protein
MLKTLHILIVWLHLNAACVLEVSYVYWIYLVEILYINVLLCRVTYCYYLGIGHDGYIYTTKPGKEHKLKPPPALGPFQC